MGDRRDPGDDPDQHPLRAGGQLLEPVDVVEVVHHDGAHARVEGHGQLGGGLGVAVQVDLLGRGPGGQRHDELAGPGHVDAEPFFGGHLVHRQAGERLGGERHAGVRVAGGEAVLEPAGLGAQARLVHDVGGGAEALGEVAHADAADGQFPVRGDRAVLGEEREQVAVGGPRRVVDHDRHPSRRAWSPGSPGVAQDQRQRDARRAHQETSAVAITPHSAAVRARDGPTGPGGGQCRHVLPAGQGRRYRWRAAAALAGLPGRLQQAAVGQPVPASGTANRTSGAPRRPGRSRSATAPDQPPAPAGRRSPARTGDGYAA